MEEQRGSPGGNGVQESPPIGQPEATPAGSPASTPPGTLQQDIVMVGLSYFGIFALIPFLSAKDNDFIRWHARQGLTLTGVYIVGLIPMAIVALIVGWLPLIGWLLVPLMWLIYSGGAFVFWLIAVIKAFGGERWKIPVVGDLSLRWGN